MESQRLGRLFAPLIHQKALRLWCFDCLDSTNQFLADLPPQPWLEVAIARTQTAGRGQWGRSWTSPLGGLYLSLGLVRSQPISLPFHLTMLSGVAIAQMLRDHGIPVALKWPNDLTLRGKKLGGIKTEIASTTDQQQRIVIGLGLNWANPVPPTGINLQNHQGDGLEDLETLGVECVRAIRHSYQNYQRQGIAPLLTRYQDLWGQRGRSIVYEGQTLTLIAVNEQGDLIAQAHSPGSRSRIAIPPGAIRLGYPTEEGEGSR